MGSKFELLPLSQSGYYFDMSHKGKKNFKIEREGVYNIYSPQINVDL